MDLNLSRNWENATFWSVGFCGAETWTLRSVDRKYLRSFETGAGEGWRRSAGPIVLHGVREERNILHAVE